MLSFEVDELKEKDVDGNDVDTVDKHSVDSFDDVDFKFTKVDTQAKYDGVPVTNVNLSATLPPSSSLEIMVYLFRQAGKVTFGNETFRVEKGTVKFNIKVNVVPTRGDIGMVDTC